MIIALPSGLDHVADALVDQLGYTAVHVDGPCRELLVALDPIVSSDPVIVNIGATPRLSDKLERVDGSWEKATAKFREISRLVDAARQLVAPMFDVDGDVVIVGVDKPEQRAYLPDGARLVVSAGRTPGWLSDDEIALVVDAGGDDDQALAVIEYASTADLEPVA